MLNQWPFVTGDSRRYKVEPPFAVALQGGGAYGAYTWGILDRLLEERAFYPVALSGASAGALNAVVLAHGLLTGGAEGARKDLAALWTAIGQMSVLNPLSLPGIDLQFEMLTKMVSPYQFNPLNLNPLRDLVGGIVDFAKLHEQRRIGLFIAATDVVSGEPRIFREHEISLDVLMASSCIPSLNHAVEIEGRDYWDGGFSSNPPILPMVLDSPCRHLLVIKLTPDEEPGSLTAAPDISARLRRILFNTSLLRDLAALKEMRKQIRFTTLLSGDHRRLRDLVVRVVTIDHRFFGAGNGSALGPRHDLIDRLHRAGREAADAMLNGT